MDKIQKAIIESDEYQRALRRMGDRAVRAASSAAPRESGNLARSVEYEITPDGRLLIYSNLDYAVFVDQGTSQTPAQPFLSGAALDAMRE